MRVLLLLALIGFALAEQKLYKGYKVIRTTPRSAEDLTFLKHLQDHDIYDFWKPPRKENLSVDVMVTPIQAPRLLQILKDRRMPHNIMIEDVEKLIPRHKMLKKAHNPKIVKTKRQFDFEEYYQTDDIYAYLDELASTYSDVVTQEVIGQSYEGREMRLVTVSNGASGTQGVWIDSGIHAREWISPAVGLFMLTELLQSNQHFLDNFHFYFLPVANPDGYEFSHTDERFWRKTRSVNEGYSCYGADPNRNFPHFAWGGEGTSSYPCSEIYHGSAPTSEIEVANFVESVYEKLPNDITLFLTLHSYSQMVMVPYGYTYPPVYPEDYDELIRLGEVGADALYAVHGKVFEVDNTAELLGPAAGATDDWAKETVGIKYVYTIELRDTGFYGFALPPEQIIPSGEEMWALLDAMLRDLAARKKP